ncbi:hypothetical protein ANCDUO_11131 [Ancylostoma duodenale]|uniref:Uncharacterized protein n=1 Tax=Ancylostoma duodenale TaxID=51022 RepID=A0A0C2CPH6_9BILA|nr:hypothetical protein ANCDUO_11131 [Ancylostoma duodenale]
MANAHVILLVLCVFAVSAQWYELLIFLMVRSHFRSPPPSSPFKFFPLPLSRTPSSSSCTLLPWLLWRVWQWLW